MTCCRPKRLVLYRFELAVYFWLPKSLRSALHLRMPIWNCCGRLTPRMAKFVAA